MGHRKSLVKQTMDRLDELSAFGCKKTDAPDKIRSFNTYNNYKNIGCLFARWVKEEHSDVRNLEDAKKYIDEFLQRYVNKGNSPWTISTYATALNKIYNNPTNLEMPKRERQLITRSRENKHVGHFSETKNADLVEFCKATGLRHHEIEKLRPEDIYKAQNGDVMVIVRQGKGGKYREVTALNEFPLELAKKCTSERLFKSVHKNAPTHLYRADYANAFYDRLARPIAEIINPKEKYHCRKDYKGITFDKVAMLKVSESLGHHRLDVMASNYLRKK